MYKEKIDIEKLLESLDDESIINIVTNLGADRYIDRENYIIFPTICHNEISEEASMKLYYYKDTKLFHCYTECDSSFNIFKLYEKVNLLKGIDITFGEILHFIVEETKFENLYTFEKLG